MLNTLKYILAVIFATTPLLAMNKDAFVDLYDVRDSCDNSQFEAILDRSYYAVTIYATNCIGISNLSFINEHTSPHLRELILSGTSVSDVSNLKYFVNLEILKISNTRTTIDALVSLSKALPKCIIFTTKDSLSVTIKNGVIVPLEFSEGKQKRAGS